MGSSKIRSHPDLFLEQHLAQVGKVAVDLVRATPIDFRSLGVSKDHLTELALRTAIFHDIGKATEFFKRRLETGWKGPNGEHEHAQLSAVLAQAPLAMFCQTVSLPPWVALGPLMAIAGHHSSISADIPNDLVMSDRIQALLPELYSLPDLYGITFSELKRDPDPVAIACAIEDLQSELHILDSWQRRDFRLLTLLLYSVLLEADKAFLAVDDPQFYDRKRLTLSPATVDNYRTRFQKPATELHRIREGAYAEVMEQIDFLDLQKQRLFSLTLPTGTGKTLLAASWALKVREKLRLQTGYTPQIIVAMPFLSIIDQTAQVYSEVFNQPAEDILLVNHSLASWDFKGYEADTAEFFVRIWKAEIVITTFDQLLFAIFGLKAKHLMRFHNLTNAILIFDEVQALPPHLWDLFTKFLSRLAEIGGTYVLVMSATQPGFLETATELVPSIETKNGVKGPERYFERLNRYMLRLKHGQSEELCFFIESLRLRLGTMEENKVLIVLNTRDSARQVYEQLRDYAGDRECYFLSSYVTPAERLGRIQRIKSSQRVFVVSTQCIEAGVDVDMDYVIRDFGPLDSIIQVAGRCNREGQLATRSVEIVRLKDPDSMSVFCPTGEFHSMVYHELAIRATMCALGTGGKDDVSEPMVYAMARDYFNEIRKTRDLGIDRTQCLLDFSHHYRVGGKERDFDIRRELRGDMKQYTLIVEEQAPYLREQIGQAMARADRWDRRRALKQLSQSIARHSISVNAYKFAPEDIAERGEGDFWYLRPGYYDKNVGFAYQRKGWVIV